MKGFQMTLSALALVGALDMAMAAKQAWNDYRGNEPPTLICQPGWTYSFRTWSGRLQVVCPKEQPQT